jgi:hypothetical protein
MLRTILLLAIFPGIVGTANAMCPETPVRLCQMVADSPVVVRAKVVSTQDVVDRDDPDGVAGWLYHLDVIRNYRNDKPGRIAVASENTTSRVILETGREYIVFASRNSEGQLETANYCDPYSAREFDKRLEAEVVACLNRNAQPKK